MNTQNNTPNILFCLADDAGLHMGAYGCPWVSTPAFDRVAREGILFNCAYTPNAKCAPSRAAILTGRNSWQLEDAGIHMGYWPAKFKTFMEALRDDGWHVGHTQKGWGPGIPGEIDGKPRELTGPAWNDRTLDPPTPDISSNDYAANFRDFLDAKPEGQPFCFWFGCVEPHRGYEYGSGVRLGGRSIDEIDHVPRIWPDHEVVRNDLLDYGFEIEHFDRHIAQMIETLEDRDELENTLIVITSDNGMPFPRVKGQEYEMSNHLPMAAMWPAGIRNPGRSADEYISFIDLCPTFLELAGLDPAATGLHPITGKSMLDVFNDETVAPERDHVLIGKERHDVGRPKNVGYPIRGIFKDGWLYLVNFEPDRWPAGNPETGYPNTDGSPTKTECIKARQNPETRHFWEWSFGKRPEEELYHIEKDPDCLDNRAADSGQETRRQAMREQLFAELTEQDDPRMRGEGDIFDTYPLLSDWFDNWYERFTTRHETGEVMEPGWISETDVEELNE